MSYPYKLLFIVWIVCAPAFSQSYDTHKLRQVLADYRANPHFFSAEKTPINMLNLKTGEFVITSYKQQSEKEPSMTPFPDNVFEAKDCAPLPMAAQSISDSIQKYIFGNIQTIQVLMCRDADTQMYNLDKKISIEPLHLDASKFVTFFIIAHEFSHFIINAYESEHGTTPSGFIQMQLPQLKEFFTTHADGSETFDDDEMEKYSAAGIEKMMFESNKSHQEVDLMAALILRDLKVPMDMNQISKAFCAQDENCDISVLDRIQNMKNYIGPDGFIIE